MRRNRIGFALGIVALVLTVTSLAAGQVADPVAKASLSKQDEKTLDSFLEAAKAYLAIEHSAPSTSKLKPTTDVAELERRRGALRSIIVAARPNAKQGELFTPPVADLIRRQMAQAMDGSRGKGVRRSLQDSEPGAATQAPKIAVNGNFPNQNGQPRQSVPATVLQCLPILPKGLDYRMVGNILVLRDTEANLVVDYLPNSHK